VGFGEEKRLLQAFLETLDSQVRHK
jgi:hypothetical protein